MQKNSVKHAIWIVLVLAFLLRLWSLYLLTQSRQGYLAGDGAYYHLLARNLQEGSFRLSLPGTSYAVDQQAWSLIRVVNRRIFKTAIVGQPTNFWSPGYPAFLAANYMAFGIHLWVPAILGVLLGTVGCWLLWRIGSRLIGFTGGLLASCLWAVHPLAVLYSPRLESETLASVLLLWISNLWVQWRCRGECVNVRRATLLGLSLGLLFYVRSFFILLLPGLVIAVAWSRQKHNIRSASVILLFFFLAVIPWGIRNQRVIGRFMLTETRGIHVFYGELTGKTGTQPRFAEMQGTTELECWEEQVNYVIDILRNDPWILIRLIAVNLRYGFMPFKNIHWALLPVDLLIIGCILWGAWFLRSRLRVLFPLMLFVVLYSGSVLLFIKVLEGRFRLCVESLLTICLAATGLKLWDRFIKPKPTLISSLSQD